MIEDPKNAAKAKRDLIFKAALEAAADALRARGLRPSGQPAFHTPEEIFEIKELGVRLSLIIDESRYGLLVSQIDPKSELKIERIANGLLIQTVGNEMGEIPDGPEFRLTPDFENAGSSAVRDEIKIDLTVARLHPEDDLEVFFGRTQGKHWREHFELDKHDLTGAKLAIVIPQETIALDETFFFGFLGQSVQNLGKDQFLEKYRFVCSPGIKSQVDLAVEQSMRRYNFSPGLM